MKTYHVHTHLSSCIFRKLLWNASARQEDLRYSRRMAGRGMLIGLISASTGNSRFAVPPSGDKARLPPSAARESPVGPRGILQHHDVIRACDCAHAVGDDQYRLACQQAGQRALHLRLIFQLQACGGLVQRTIGASLSSARAMEMRCRSPPESLAPFSPIAYHNPWAACERTRRVGGSGCGAHFFIARAAPAQADVFHHGIVKQHHVLKDHGVIAQQYFRVYSRDYPRRLPGSCRRSRPTVSAASRAQVLFPEPEGPTRAVTSPSLAVKLTSCRTSFFS